MGLHTDHRRAAQRQAWEHRGGSRKSREDVALCSLTLLSAFPRRGSSTGLHAGNLVISSENFLEDRTRHVG